METIDITIIESDSGLPLFSQMETKIDEANFAGFLKAIQSFAKDMALGELSNFVTNDKNIYLVGREYVTVAILAPKKLDFQEVYSLAYTLGIRFEKKYQLAPNQLHDASKYKDFAIDVKEVLSQHNVPYLVKIAEFVKKEIGGEVSIQPVLINRQKEEVSIDLVADSGMKKGTIHEKFHMRIHKAFSANVAFVKAIEGTAGRGEVLEFFDSIRNFGTNNPKEEPDIFPHFPAKAIVIAKDFSPTLLEEMKKYGNTIVGSHLTPIAKVEKKHVYRCYIEFWQWNDPEYPKRIFG